MNVLINKKLNGQHKNSPVTISQTILGFILATTGFSLAVAGQAVTGKIIIDGVVYGDGSSQLTRGDGIQGKEDRRVDKFNSVIIDGGVDVNFQQSPETNVIVTGDQNLLPLVTTESRNGLLSIDSKRSYQARLPVIVKLASPELRMITLEGAGDMSFTNLASDSLELVLNGSSHVQLSGKVKQIAIKINGSGDVDAKKLRAVQADINNTGSGDVNLTVTGSLNAEIEGSGDVNYWGNPETVTKNVAGSGEVESGE